MGRRFTGDIFVVFSYLCSGGLKLYVFFNIYFRYALMEMGLDFPELPLGMVTDLHLKRCKASLNSYYVLHIVTFQ